MFIKMPKATQKSTMEGEEEEAGLHGTTNPEEARRHIYNLDAMLVKMEESIILDERLSGFPAGIQQL